MAPSPYFFLVILCGVALVFPLGPLALAWLWRRFLQPPRPGPKKNATYECGVESSGEARVQFGDGEFKVLATGDFVRCAVSGEPIALADLRYWNVERQEAYASAALSLQRTLELRARERSHDHD